GLLRDACRLYAQHVPDQPADRPEARVTRHAIAAAVSNNTPARANGVPGRFSPSSGLIAHANDSEKIPGPSILAIPAMLGSAARSWPCSPAPTRRLISAICDGFAMPQSACHGMPARKIKPVGAIA